MEYKVGDKGTFKNLPEIYNGTPIVIDEVGEDAEGVLLKVHTKACIGSIPSGVDFEIHPYEFEKEE